ncbi:MAG: hypothetical protein AAGJ83_11030 [Planctomycetota bacterium]
MDLQGTTFDQLWAATGLAVLAIAAAAILVLFLIMAGCLKFSISLIAQHKISFVAAFGYLIAITIINSLIGSIIGSVAGPLGGLIALPLTIFATLACIAQAGDCGYLRALGVYIVFCFTATFGMFGAAMVLLVPLAMIGNLGEGLTDDFLQAREQSTEFENGGIREVNWETFGMTASEEPAEDADAPLSPKKLETSAPAIDLPPDPPKTPQSTVPANRTATPSNRTAPTPTRPQRQKKPIRAPDGTQLNPFFK